MLVKEQILQLIIQFNVIYLSSLKSRLNNIRVYCNIAIKQKSMHLLLRCDLEFHNW